MKHYLLVVADGNAIGRDGPFTFSEERDAIAKEVYIALYGGADIYWADIDDDTFEVGVF